MSDIKEMFRSFLNGTSGILEIEPDYADYLIEKYTNGEENPEKEIKEEYGYYLVYDDHGVSTAIYNTPESGFHYRSFESPALAAGYLLDADLHQLETLNTVLAAAKSSPLALQDDGSIFFIEDPLLYPAPEIRTASLVDHSRNSSDLLTAFKNGVGLYNPINEIFLAPSATNVAFFRLKLADVEDYMKQGCPSFKKMQERFLVDGKDSSIAYLPIRDYNDPLLFDLATTLANDARWCDTSALDSSAIKHFKNVAELDSWFVDNFDLTEGFDEQRSDLIEVKPIYSKEKRPDDRQPNSQITMKQLNVAIRAVIDTNKDVAEYVLSRPETSFTDSLSREAFQSLLVLPQFIDSQEVLHAINQEIEDTPSLAESIRKGNNVKTALEVPIDNILKQLLNETNGRTDEQSVEEFKQGLWDKDRFRLNATQLSSFVEAHGNLLNAMIDALEQDGWNVTPYEDDPGYVEIERWTDGTGCDMILGIDLRGKNLDSPSDWKNEVNDLVNGWDVEEEAVLNYEAPGAPSLVEIIDDFRDFKNNELARIASITEKVSDAWKKETMKNKDLESQHGTQDLSAKRDHATEMSHLSVANTRDEMPSHDEDTVGD